MNHTDLFLNIWSFVSAIWIIVSGWCLWWLFDKREKVLYRKILRDFMDLIKSYTMISVMAFAIVYSTHQKVIKQR